MKLLFCKACQDVIRLISTERRCRCGKTRGRYVDDIHAVYSGRDAVPLGFKNSIFAWAVTKQPDHGDGLKFDAFVIPMECNTFKKES